ncbi:MAG TPA: glycosyltransferase N-terminal domain-containing protein [Panacibacter sp.]|nr:glycosyltransferase N-terminal domain-containing protein [Panacibacter sp.]
MGKLFYILFVKFYPLGAGIAALFNNKARLWVKGRKNIFTTIQLAMQHDNANRIWIHCSSLGEFEQGRPLIESIKKNYPAYSVVLTFFSPSGYEHEKNYKGANHVFYMPVDSSINAQKFYDLVQPKMVVFIKYEFWYYYLSEAKKRGIPLLLVSGMFRKSQAFFKWYGNFYREMLQCFTQLFVQTEAAKQLLQSIEINHAIVGGDTRFDRVLEVADHFKPIPEIEAFCAGKTVIVAGSTWLEDDEELDHYANTHTEYRFIIAPHNIGEERLKECERLYKNSIRYSSYLLQDEVDKNQSINTIIIDNIGMLKQLYAYATVCYVGGAFGGDGVHNVPEAAVYSKPVIFGPVYEKYAEAVELVEIGGAFTVVDAIELEEILNELLEDKEAYLNACVKAGTYVKSKTGATETVMNYIQEKRLLTN